jgi:hypothetical protein
MSSIFGKMVAISARIDEIELSPFLTSSDAGKRLAAYSYLYAKPDVDVLAQIVNNITSGLEDRFRRRYDRQREGCFAKSEAVPTFSDYGEIGVVADLFGLPEVAAVVSGHVRQEGAHGHFGPLERPRSLGSGQVEAVGFLNELG